jgi:hypothetical protein
VLQRLRRELPDRFFGDVIHPVDDFEVRTGHITEVTGRHHYFLQAYKRLTCAPAILGTTPTIRRDEIAYGSFAAIGISDENADFTTRRVLQGKQILENPGVIGTTIKTGRPLGLVLLVKLIAFRDSFTARDTIYSTFCHATVLELNPSLGEPHAVSDVLGPFGYFFTVEKIVSFLELHHLVEASVGPSGFQQVFGFGFGWEFIVLSFG